MKIVKTLSALATSAFLTTQATAQTNLEPLDCPQPSDLSMSEAWMASEAREAHYNSHGSAARQERGKTYGAFMDAFWSDLDARFTAQEPTTVAELFDGISESYQEAYRTAAAASLAHGVTPQLVIRAPARNRINETELNHQGITLLPSDLSETMLSENQEFQEMLPFDGIFDTGIDVEIRFMANWGDYLIQSVGNDLGAYTSLSLEDPVETLIGFKRADDLGSSYESIWDKVNVRNDVICPRFY